MFNSLHTVLTFLLALPAGIMSFKTAYITLI